MQNVVYRVSQDTESEIEATLLMPSQTIFPVAWTWPTGKKITCPKTNLFQPIQNL